MTRPTRFGHSLALIGGRLGNIGIPDSAPPTPDCCAIGETPPDRAFGDNGGYVVMLGGSNSISYVQIGATTNTGASTTISVTLGASPTVDNMLVAIFNQRGGGSPSAATMPAGWDRRTDYIGAAFDGGPAVMWTKVALPGESATITVTKNGGVGARPVVLEFAGVAFDQAANASAVGVASSLAAGPMTPSATPALLVAAINQSSRTGTYTWGSSFTEVDDAHIDASGPSMTVGYRIINPASGAYTATVTSTDTADYGWGMVGFIGSTAEWNVPAPLTNDDNDTTYETPLAGTGVLRADLGRPFRIAQSRMRIACQFAGSKTYTITGATLADMSDGVVLATVTFTGTGTYTAQDVDFSWEPTAEYQFYQLDGTNETRRIHTWELREANPGTTWVTDPITGATVTTQVAFDDLAGPVVGYLAHGNMGATETFDAATGWHSGTFNANCTFTLTALASGLACQLLLELLQDGTGGWTMTLPASVTNKAALEAAQVTTLGTTSLLLLMTRDGGTTWYGFWAGGASPSLTIKDEGTPLATGATSIDFVGAAVTASGATGAKTVTIPWPTLDNLTDVVITTATTADRLRFDGSNWVNSALIWRSLTVFDPTSGLWLPLVDGSGNQLIAEA